MNDGLSADFQRQADEWLEADEWQLVQTARAGWTWALGATDGQGRKLVVGQRDDKFDQIIVQGFVFLEHPSDTRIGGLTQEDRASLLRGLQFELIRFGLEFSGIEFPTERIEVYQRLFVENMTKAAFLETVSKVRNGLFLLCGMLEQENWT